MPQDKTKSMLDLLLSLPWWIGAVLADAAFFAPNIAKQIYPPSKSPEGLPVYNEIVYTAEALSLYLTIFFVVFAATALIRKTMTVRKKVHQSVKHPLQTKVLRDHHNDS